MENNDGRLDHSLKILAKSSFIVFIGVLFSKVFSYVYRIIIAREFGPETYGIFSLAMMVSGLFIVFSSMGIGDGLTRYIPLYRGKNQKEKIKYLIRRFAKIFFISGIAATVLMLILSQFIANKIFNEPELYEFLVIFSFIIPINLFLTILISSLKGYEKIGWYSFLSNILIPLSNLVLILLFMFMGIGVYSVILSYVLGELIVLILSFIVTKKQIPEIFEKIKKSKEKGLLKEVILYSFPLFLAGMSWKLFKWGDSFVIGLFKSVADVGIYNAAVPVAMLLAMAPQLFMQLFFPLITRFYSQGDKKTISEIAKQTSKWIFILNIPLLVLFIVFPTEFLRIFFGEVYIPAANSLRFISIGVFFLSFFEISYRLIAMKGLSKILLIDIVSISVLNVLLNMLLVPYMGISGAAIATMFSYILLSFVGAYQSARYLSIIPLDKKMLNISFAAIIPLIILILIKGLVPQGILSFIILSIFFSLVYFSLVFIFNGLDKNDIMIINASLRKLRIKYTIS